MTKPDLIKENQRLKEEMATLIERPGSYEAMGIREVYFFRKGLLDSFRPLSRPARRSRGILEMITQ